MAATYSFILSSPEFIHASNRWASTAALWPKGSSPTVDSSPTVAPVPAVCRWRLASTRRTGVTGPRESGDFIQARRQVSLYDTRAFGFLTWAKSRVIRTPPADFQRSFKVTILIWNMSILSELDYIIHWSISLGRLKHSVSIQWGFDKKNEPSYIWICLTPPLWSILGHTHIVAVAANFYSWTLTKKARPNQPTENRSIKI